MKKEIFIFKDDVYTLKELIIFNNSQKNLFQDGIVVNSETGEEFEISEIHSVREKYFEHLSEIKDIIEDNNTSRTIWALTQDEIDRKIKELNVKFSKNKITLDELEILLKLEKGVKFNKFDNNFYVILQEQGTFYKKFHKFKYPISLSKSNIGSLHLLLDFMTYRNEIKRTQNDKSNYPTTKELMEYMRVKDESALSRVLRDLKKYNIIDYKREKGKKIIYINPLFSNRNLKIHPELYRRFKDDIDEVLSDKEIKYLEMLTFSDSENGTIVIED